MDKYKKLHHFFGGKTNEVVTICIALYEQKLHGNPRTSKEACAELFTALCRIAKSRHCNIQWDGNHSPCQPDKFTIVKNGMEYHTIIDGIRYDGVNANCRCNGRYFA
jgi:hypothetical protein